MASIKSMYDHPFATYHTKSYASISPVDPSLSLEGKTALITGGGQGISRGVVDSYAKAGISNLILLSRRAEPLEAAKTELEAAFPKIKVYVYAGSITDVDFITKTFADIRLKISDPDILICNATQLGPQAPVLQLPVTKLQETLDVNVLGNLNLVQNFLSVPSTLTKPKTIIDISSAAAQILRANGSAYGTTKAFFTTLLMTLQREVAADGTQPGLAVHSFHPGAVLTEMAQENGYTKESIADWTERDLPSDYSVWLASKKASFLSGRFTWCNWDVDEMAAKSEQIQKSGTALVFGLQSV